MLGYATLYDNSIKALLDWVEDPVLVTGVREQVKTNKLVHDLLSRHGLLDAAWEAVLPEVVAHSEEGADCRPCRLQQHFLTPDPSPTWVGSFVPSGTSWGSW